MKSSERQLFSQTTDVRPRNVTNNKSSNIDTLETSNATRNPETKQEFQCRSTFNKLSMKKNRRARRKCEQKFTILARQLRRKTTRNKSSCFWHSNIPKPTSNVIPDETCHEMRCAETQKTFDSSKAATTNRNQKLVSHSYQTTKDKMKPPTHTKICEILKPKISARNQNKKS